MLSDMRRILVAGGKFHCCSSSLATVVFNVIFVDRYFALELFDATLEHYCSREYNGPMPCKANVLCQISDGLNYLHGIGLAHGHLSPCSIMIVKKSESVVIKISDFLCK
jgi:serine/threonine protein kinase